VLRDLRPTLALALPVIAAEIGWISMGIVDTMIVRALGPAAIGAVGTGSTLFMTLMVLGIGTLFSLDTFVSHAFGAGRIDDCHRWLFAGLYLAAGLSVVSVLIGLWGVTWLPRMGLHPAVRDLLAPYLVRLLWSAPPLLVYTVCRRYLQAMNVVWPVMFSLVTANIVNAVGNWAFVYGRLGMPALGVAGCYSRLSRCFSRSMDSRTSRRAPCAASATPARRWCSI
jgi:MATE family multidrug resistance protein